MFAFTKIQSQCPFHLAIWSNCQHALDQRFQWSATNQVHSRKKNTYFYVIEYIKAFDCVDHNKRFCQSIQLLSRVQLFANPYTAAQQASLSITNSQTYSCPLSRWCHPTISFSVVPFSSHLHSFWVSGSFPRSRFFTSIGQSIGVLASALVLPVNIQDWFPLGLTDLISLQSKGLSRVFSNTTV